VTADGLTVESNSNLAANLTNPTDSGGYHGLRIDTTNTSIDTLPLYVKSNNLDRFQVKGNGDISFYEDTGTTAKFYWDASAERLGIGDTTPAGILDITKDSTTTWTTTITSSPSYSPRSHELAIKNTTDNTTNSYAGIYFQAGQTSTGSQISSARIAAIRTGAYAADLAFATRTSVGSHDMVERMRIDDQGRVTTPYQPAWAIYSSSTWGWNNNILPMTSTKYVQGGVSHSTSTGAKITVPTTGKYYIGIRGLMNTGFGNFFWKINVNGSWRSYIYCQASSGTYDMAEGNNLIDLVAGDYIEIYGTGSHYGFYGGYGDNAFYGYLLG